MRGNYSAHFHIPCDKSIYWLSQQAYLWGCLKFLLGHLTCLATPLLLAGIFVFCFVFSPPFLSPTSSIAQNCTDGFMPVPSANHLPVHPMPTNCQLPSLHIKPARCHLKSCVCFWLVTFYSVECCQGELSWVALSWVCTYFCNSFFLYLFVRTLSVVFYVSTARNKWIGKLPMGLLSHLVVKTLLKNIR